MSEYIPHVQLVCQFGKPVRGISPYADELLSALKDIPDVQVMPIDYRAAFPGGMHPAVHMHSKIEGELHWANPLSWYRAARADAELIHIQHWLAPMADYLWPLASMARRNGKAVLVTVHNPRSHETMTWAEPFERRLFASANALIVHDERGKHALQSRLGDMLGPAYVVPHGVRATPVQERRLDDCALIGLDPTKRYICLFGNLREYKGVEVLLRAWAQVKRQVPDVDLVIAGRLWEGGRSITARVSAHLLGTDKQARRVREAMANPALAGQVHFWQGFLSDTIINALLRISEFAVFPYIRFASQSGAACRAAGMGCPVLVSDVGGLPDLAVGPDWIVPPGDVDALADSLISQLKKQRKNELRQEQMLRIRPYEWGKIAVQHFDIYRSLVSARSAHA